MNYSSRISTFISTIWRNQVVGIVLTLEAVVLADASVFRHDPRGQHIFDLAVAMFIVGVVVVVSAIAHALWRVWRRT